MFYRHTASFKICISKVQDFSNFELSPILKSINHYWFTCFVMLFKDNHIYLIYIECQNIEVFML